MLFIENRMEEEEEEEVEERDVSLKSNGPALKGRGKSSRP